MNLGTRFKLKDKQSERIARSFVRKARLVSEWRSRLPLAAITHLRMQGAPARGEAQREVLLDAGVVFRREIDGVPVTGPGGLVVVTISPEASVAAVTRVWRELGRRVARVDVMSPEEAIERVRDAYKRKTLTGTPRVVRAEFGYFEAGPDQAQRFIEPCFAFVIESTTQESSDSPPMQTKTVEVVPAVDRPRQRWLMRRVDQQSPSPARRLVTPSR